MPRRAIPRALALLAVAACTPTQTSPAPAASSTASAAAPGASTLPAAVSATAPATVPASGSASAPASGSASAPASGSASAPAPGSASAPASASASASASATASGPCPPDMALVGRFCVDRWEAHLAVDNGSAEPTPHPHSQRPQDGVRYLARSAAGAFPQAFISRVEAKAACVAAGKRLCSRKEWLRACKHNGSEMYPYGPNGKRGQCSTGKLHLLTLLFGEKKRGWTYEEFNDPKLALEPGYLAKAGEYTGCASELGVHDMVGNLHEWVSDMVDQDLMDRLAEEEVERREQPWREGNGVFMGGFFSTTSELGPGCYYTTVAHEPAYHDYSTGFRCCGDAKLPEPEKQGGGKGKKKKAPSPEQETQAPR